MIPIPKLWRPVALSTPFWPIRGSSRPKASGRSAARVRPPATAAPAPSPITWPGALTSNARGLKSACTTLPFTLLYREEIRVAINRFIETFGGPPRTMAHHYFCDDNLYWGEGRVSGINRLVYNILTRFQNRNKFFGHVEGHPCFWGDLCRKEVTYTRNFVFGEINTLKACPYMPYHDPDRPFVNQWYASSEGANAASFVNTINEEA